jgi:heterodisulfide reductase subunit D
MPAERCCGHDLLWSGDRDGFLRLARLDVAKLNALGIKEVTGVLHRTKSILTGILP